MRPAGTRLDFAARGKPTADRPIDNRGSLERNCLTIDEPMPAIAESKNFRRFAFDAAVPRSPIERRKRVQSGARDIAG